MRVRGRRLSAYIAETMRPATMEQVGGAVSILPVRPAMPVAVNHRVSVVLADPFPLMLTAIHELLSRCGYVVIGAFTDGVAAIASVQRHRPPLAIIDLPLKGLSGLEILRAIRAERIGTKVLLLTDAAEAQVQEAMALGVSAVVSKSLPEAALIDAIVACLGSCQRSADQVANDSTVELVPSAPAVASLSARDREIVELVLRGWRNKEIARRTGDSEASVKFRLYTIYRRLGVASRMELVYKARDDRRSAEPEAVKYEQGSGHAR
jgi:DNA-binding NarL/FixJ family response regulator